MARVLAVDPGDVRIGLALSDPTGLIARPLQVIQHTKRSEDALLIVQKAEEFHADIILVGLPLDQDGNIGHQARKTLKLVQALRERTSLKIQTWDESGTTKRALEDGQASEMLDARAAAYMLQDFLDATE